MKKILIPLILFLLVFSTVVLGAPSYVNIGPTTEFTGDVGVPSGSGYYIGGTEIEIDSLIEGWTFTHTEDQLFFGELAGARLGNLHDVAINTTLISDTADTDSLGSTAYEWLNLYIGDAGKIFLGLSQDISIHRNAANEMTLTASSGVTTSAGLTITGNATINTASEPALTISMTSITGEDNQAIDIIGGEALGAEEHWTGIRVKPDDLDPSGADSRIRGLAINMSGIDTTNVPENLAGVRIVMPSGLTGIARANTEALYISGSDVEHHFSVPSTGTAEFTAYDMIVDAGSLASTSDIHCLDVATANGAPAGDVCAVGTHTYVSPICQYIGSYSTPSQTEYAGRKTAGGANWVDGIDGVEIFVVNSDEIYLGSTSQFSEIEIIFGTAATKTVSPTFWYNTAADTWTQFYPADDTSGFQNSGLVRWDAASITALWTNDGDPGGASASIGYWIKIIRTAAPDPGTPTPTTMKIGTVTEYDWNESGDLTIHDIDANDIDAASLILDTALSAAEGGTGVANNVTNTLTFTGNYSLGLTLTANTALTLPTSGTLVNSAVTSLSSLATIGTVTSGTLSTGAVLADVTMTLGSDADGDIYYRSSNKLTRLPKGIAAQLLKMNAGATAPEWGSAAAGYTNLTEFVDQTAWRVFYSNTSGDVIELALGASGTYLKSNGAAAAPTFATPAGAGDVTKVGTPTNSQIGVWTGDGTIEGAASLTYDGSNLQLTGDIGSTGTKITKGWFTDLEVANAIAGSITGNAITFTVADESVDATCFPLFVTAAIGNLSPKSAAGLAFNSSTDILTATGFAGPLTGNVTGDCTGSSGTCSGLAATATALATGRTIGGVSFDGTANIVPDTITVADTTDTTSYVSLWESATGDLAPKSDAGITYNAGTGMLTATGFTGPLTGEAATVATIAGLAPNTATTQATQASITTCANLVSIGTIATGVWEGTDVGLAHGGTGVSDGAMVNFTSILNAALYIGRDADNQIKFATDNNIVFRLAGVDGALFGSTGELDMNANSIGFTQQTVAYNSATTTADWTNGNKAIMTFGTGNITTFAFTNPTNPCNVVLKIVQDGTGSRVVTNWDADIKWAGGSAPTLSTGANAIDIISFYWDGTNYFGVASLNFS